MITLKEVGDAIKSLQNNKASGVDNISAEILKCPDLLDLAWRFIFYCYETKTVPAEWHTSMIVPVFKKGDSSSCNNYRGIALMSVYAKLYNRILFVRLRDTLEKHLRPNQNGFRPLRSTAQQVLALRRSRRQALPRLASSLLFSSTSRRRSIRLTGITSRTFCSHTTYLRL